MPIRLRITNAFGERKIPPESVPPKDVYIISIAGEGKTEEQYFDGIKTMSTGNTIWIDRLEKADETDTKSHPNYVIKLLDERRKYWEEHGARSDELWMVIDRDVQNVTLEQLKNIITQCKDKDYKLAISNPTFELWLLLHITDIANYDYQTLLSNPKPSAKSKKRYLDKLLTELTDGYKKNKLNFTKFEPGINDAISRARELPLNNNTLLNKLGTNVFLLVEKIIS
jgi:hypothetical protein